MHIQVKEDLMCIKRALGVGLARGGASVREPARTDVSLAHAGLARALGGRIKML